MIKIGFVGDIALTHSYDALYGAKGPHYPFELIREVFEDHDMLIGNLESPFCLGGETYPLKVSLKAHPGYAAGMKEAGFTAVSLANNHILDYREQAFYDTIGLLDSQGILRCGAGTCLEEAQAPVIVEKDGISVGILARCDVPIDSPFYASDAYRGIAPVDLDQLARAIEELKGRVTVIAAYLHWGKEDWRYPSPEQVRAAHRIIDMGAHLVIGHHPHVLQGIERYHGGYIAYSLGNFLFSDLDWRWVDGAGEVRHSILKPGRARRESAIFSADISENGIQGITVTGCMAGRDLRVAPLKERKRFKARMRVLSQPITMSRYNAFWKIYDAAETMRGRLKYQSKRIWKIHKIAPYLVRKIRNGVPSLRARISGGAGTMDEESESQNNHRARSGTTETQPGAAPRDQEDRARYRVRKTYQSGGTAGKSNNFGKSRNKKKETAVT